MNTPNFNPEDVRKVAEALLLNPVYEWESGGGTCYLKCRYCCGEICAYWNGKPQEFTRSDHKPDCETFVAQDLLTGLTPQTTRGDSNG